MARKADIMTEFNTNPYAVIIEKVGDEDCVHHEIVRQAEESNLVGTCKKCGRVKLYQNKYKKYLNEKQNATAV